MAIISLGKQRDLADRLFALGIIREYSKRTDDAAKETVDMYAKWINTIDNRLKSHDYIVEDEFWERQARWDYQQLKNKI